MKAVIIVPAFNEAPVIYQVLKSLPKRLDGVSKLEILVVNDGSEDGTVKEALRANVKVVSHNLNRGVGAATKTGIEWAKKKKADITITFDADGQHHASDIQKVISPIILKNADLVIGSRFKNKQKIPADRFVLNWLANFATLS